MGRGRAPGVLDVGLASATKPVWHGPGIARLSDGDHGRRSLANAVLSYYSDSMVSEGHSANVERISEETERDGDGILEAMCREALANWGSRGDHPLEALEMYVEAKRFMEQEVAELVGQMRMLCEPPFSWDEIAERLGMSRQSAWTKYRPLEEGATRLRQRPGPRGAGDLIVFDFPVNASYVKNGEITVRTRFNALLDERLPGDGPSWGATLVKEGLREAVTIRRGHNPKRYYQVRVPKDVRARIGLRPREVVPVRISLLGPLTVVLGDDSAS